MRFACISSLLLACVSLLLFVLSHETAKDQARSLEALFQAAGKPVKTLDRAISTVIPVDEIDEKLLGDYYKEHYRPYRSRNSETQAYLQQLLDRITESSKKPFTYEVFLIEGAPNAMALPGGVILVTQSMMDILENEAELVSILGHEFGHIERGHCFDGARSQMLAQKFGGFAFGAIADQLLGNLLRLSFSKAQEEEADQYGFSILERKGYDLYASSGAMQRLLDTYGSKTEKGFNPIDDFLSSHPNTKSRLHSLHSQAQRWVRRHSPSPRYQGKKNLQQRVPFHQKSFEDEFVTPYLSFDVSSLSASLIPFLNPPMAAPKSCPIVRTFLVPKSTTTISRIRTRDPILIPPNPILLLLLI